MEFDTHSVMYDLINTGIELNLILGDDSTEGTVEKLERINSRIGDDKKAMLQRKQNMREDIKNKYHG